MIAMNEWGVHVWEAVAAGFGPAFVVLVGMFIGDLLSARARRNRATLRRRRRAERRVVRRQRAWVAR